MTWRLGLTCPECGHQCTHTAGSQPGDLGRRVTAVAECPSGHRWQIVVELLRVGGPPVPLPT